MKKLFTLCLFLLFLQQLSAQDTIKETNQTKKNYAVFFNKSLNKKTIEHTPYSDINKLRLFNSSAVYYGASYKTQGLSSFGDNSYIDGMLINDISMFPKSAIESYTQFDGISPIEFGNNMSDIVEVLSLQAPAKTTFDINILSDFTTNINFSMNQKGLYFTFNSPMSFLKFIYKNKNLQPSILIAGNLNFTKDPTPSSIGVTSVDSKTLAQLNQNPLIPSGKESGTYKAAEFVTNDNLTKSSLKQNADCNSFNPYIKLAFPLSKNSEITLGSYMNLTNRRLDVFENSMFNSDRNPEIKERNFNNYIRFEHNFNINSNLKSHFYLQINYTKNNYLQQSPQHKDKFFDYGYVGKFKTNRTRTYEYGTDPFTGLTAYLQNGNADTLVTFEPSDINPILANYTTNYYDFYSTSNENFSSLNVISREGGLINGVLDWDNSVYNLFSNVGHPYDEYRKSDFSRLNPKAQITFDYKNAHHFMLGFELDRTSSSSYTLKPVQLWDKARLLTNQHLYQLDIYNPHLVYDNYGIFMDTIMYDNLYATGQQTYFDKNLRQKLGLPMNGTDWIDVYSYAPETFSLDMFSADELLNNGNSFVQYSGYDYTGKKLKTNDKYDFFSDIGTNGYFSRNIGAFKPNYFDAYMQYSYTGKRLTCTLGFRLDRYDANQPVLKDPYLLYNAKTVAEVTNLGAHPANIGQDYVVYVDDVVNPTAIKGYRNGDTWYNAKGEKITDPASIETGSGIAPYLINPQQITVNSTAFTDYKRALNYLPQVKIDYLVTRTTQVFADFQMSTQNPINNNYRPDHYYYINVYAHKNYILNNPDLKPSKTTIGRIGARQILLKSLQAEVFYQYKNTKGLPIIYEIYGAYPLNYSTIRNSKDDFINHAIDISLMYKKQGKHEFDFGIYYERLLNMNKKFENIILSKNVLNAFVQYSFNKSSISGNQPKLIPILSVSLTSHYRSDTYFPVVQMYLPNQDKVKLPAFYYFDIKIEKPFYFGKQKDKSATIYVAVQNILNRKNVFSVYANTGKTDDDGYLSDPSIKPQLHIKLPKHPFALCMPNP